jgi:hypothetical protein
MSRLVVALATGLALAACAFAGDAAQARQRRAIPDPSMFAHPPCSVLDDRPCLPDVCSPLDHRTCFPQTEYPIGQDLRLTVLSHPPDTDRAKYEAPDHALNTIADLFAALRSCWRPPTGAAAGHYLQMAVRFSLKKDGSLISPPRLTYASKGATDPMREDYRNSIEQSLGGCTPLDLTPGLGGALAGRPIMVRYVDNRPSESKPEAK